MGETERLLRLSPYRLWAEEAAEARGVADLLDLTAFRESVELLSLCLGANLSSLRSICASERGGPAAAFFVSAYMNRPVHALLKALPAVGGSALVQFRERSRCLYPKLAASFGKLMRLEGGLTCFRSTQPVYRSFIANYRRLGLLKPHLTEEFLRACEELERQSETVSEAVLESVDGSN